jgi:hypothetical protein
MMDMYRRFFGESVAGTLIRLVLLSIIVITPSNLLDRLQQLVRNFLNLGFDAFHWAFQYFLLGAVIVFPIWFLVRLFGRSRDPRA